MKQTYRLRGGGTVDLTAAELETDFGMFDDGTVVRLSEATKRWGTERRRLMLGALLDHQRRFNARRATLGRMQARAATAQMPECTRAPRAAGTRTRGSRRAGASSSTSSPDPGADDPEPEPRACACGCGVSLADKAPQARFASEACRKRTERARGRSEHPPRPVWPAARIEPPAVLAVLMAEAPHGVCTESVAA